MRAGSLLLVTAVVLATTATMVSAQIIVNRQRGTLPRAKDALILTPFTPSGVADRQHTVDVVYTPSDRRVRVVLQEHRPQEDPDWRTVLDSVGAAGRVYATTTPPASSSPDSPDRRWRLRLSRLGQAKGGERPIQYDAAIIREERGIRRPASSIMTRTTVHEESGVISAGDPAYTDVEWSVEPAEGTAEAPHAAPTRTVDVWYEGTARLGAQLEAWEPGATSGWRTLAAGSGVDGRFHASTGAPESGLRHDWRLRLNSGTDTTASTTFEVRISNMGVPPAATVPVRVVYAVPADRKFRNDYSLAIQRAVLDLQAWMGRALGGRTFTLQGASPERCRLRQAEAYYVQYPWTRVFEDVRRCAPVEYGGSRFVWVVYADIPNDCNAAERLGAGTLGLTMLPRQDLEGLIGNSVDYGCDERYHFPVRRWIGGLGHELGHAMGLPHPPGCDDGLATCDDPALMWQGVYTYPNTYMRPDEMDAVLDSAFIGPRSGPRQRRTEVLFRCDAWAPDRCFFSIIRENGTRQDFELPAGERRTVVGAPGLDRYMVSVNRSNPNWENCTVSVGCKRSNVRLGYNN